MAKLAFGAAGVSAQEIDLTGPVTVQPTGIPAGVVGTAVRGRAFVPTTVGIFSDFEAKFGKTDGKKFGPLAVREWLASRPSVTFLRVMGVGTGYRDESDGHVASAGFVVGDRLPNDTTGIVENNPYANLNGPPGRAFVLGCFMSESAGSTYFSDAGVQGVGGITPGATTAVPIIRGVLFAASGVVPKLSASQGGTNSAPSATAVATAAGGSGDGLGAVVLSDAGTPKQEFVLLLNGHKGTDTQYPNVITASYDMTAVNYFGTALNRDPLKIREAGHFLYAAWDIHPALAAVTGTGIIVPASGASSPTAPKTGAESVGFLLSGSQARHTATSTVPDYEGYEYRFTHAKSPWVTSQKFGGSPQNLFRFHAIDAGAGISTGIKLSIENIVRSTDPTSDYGSFDVVVREAKDRDTDLRVLEQFRGCTLDPSADRYVAKVIGDLNTFFDFDRAVGAQKLTVEGNYPNRSNYVRVEMDTAVDNAEVDGTALPVGIRGYGHLVTSGSAPLAPVTSQHLSAAHTDALKRPIVPPVPFREHIAVGVGSKAAAKPQLYWGVRFEHPGSLTDPNTGTRQNTSIAAHATWYPDYAVGAQAAWVSANEGAVDTSALGIIDADRFCRNVFSLENIKVVTASSGLADPQQWAAARYIRAGAISADDTAKTRAWKVEDAVQSNRKYAKYSLFIQGGFDGVTPFNRDALDLTNTAVVQEMDASTGRGTNNGPTVRAYAKAVEVMQDVSEVDIQLLAIPGIRHPIVTDAAAAAVKDRFDALYIMDIEERDGAQTAVTGSTQLVSVTNTVSALEDRALNTSFAAAYFPDVVVQDPTTKTNVQVPPSVVVLGAFALNDKLAHPWFAPAGFARGRLPSTIEAKVSLSKDNMDRLYDANINPLVAYPGDKVVGLNPTGGVTVWGQKTLYAIESALDRVNVRRLLIDLRREVRSIALGFEFEPNLPATLAAFQARVVPRLERVKQLQGVKGYKVKIDTSTTTQADVENNTIRGKIIVQPKKSIEFVDLDFVVTNNPDA